jgi:hypothetical protein
MSDTYGIRKKAGGADRLRTSEFTSIDVTLVNGMTPRTCPGNSDVGKRLQNKYEAVILKPAITAFLSF